MAQLKAPITTGLVLIAVAILTVSPANADKPSWAGGGGGKHEKHQPNMPSHFTDPITGSSGGKYGKHRQKEQSYDHNDPSHYDGNRPSFSGNSFFTDRYRTVVHNYYFNEYQAGHCPPGLAKKNNGCMPPGQAKKWTIGSPLPRDVVFYDLPSPLAVSIGPPPAGYRFVRVASDILMLSIGTGMVMDAITDLGGL